MKPRRRRLSLVGLLVFICILIVLNTFPDLRKKSELLYYIDEKLMFASYSKIVLMALASLPSGAEK